MIGQKLKKHSDEKNETETIQQTVANVEKEDTTEENERDPEEETTLEETTTEETTVEETTEAPTEAPTNIVIDVSIETPGDFHADIFADEYQKNQLKINHPEFSISQELSNRFAAILGPASTNVKFYALALDETFSFGYNPDTSYFAACSVKAGFALNLYKQVEQGNINLNDIMVYQEGMFHGGSGIIRNDPYGTEYTVQQVIDYSLLHSDNIAYDMVRDMVKIMREIFWYGQSSSYGSYLLNTLQNTEWNYFQEEIPDKICQSKIGWTEDVCTMTGIVYGDKPYLLCVSSTTEEIFRQVVVLCDDIVDEYIQYENR